MHIKKLFFYLDKRAKSEMRGGEYELSQGRRTGAAVMAVRIGNWQAAEVLSRSPA